MSETKKVGFFKKIGSYFRELKSEVKKVTWPTFKQVRNNTGIVIIAVIIVGILIALFDLAFQGIWMLIS
ncbi:MAG: preprotein translocase subunit SecE [Clostridia bacterium]|nr:preprotein translocase subunit SecE [Clostridia bacterium]